MTAARPESATSHRLLGLDADTDAESCVIQGNRVAMCGMRAPAGAEGLDCHGAAVIPGFVNAHTHLYSALFPIGLPVPDPYPRTLVDVLEQVWWRLDRALDPASLRAAARLYAAEALLAGTTAVFDHHESPGMIEGSLDVIANACDEVGLRAVLTYGATERNGGRAEARRGLAECERFLARNRRPLIGGMIGLHAGFTVSDDTIRETGALARRLQVPIHVHMGEDPVDVAVAGEHGYPGALQRFKELGALYPGSVLAHCVHLSELEVRTAAAAGCWLVHNPRSNARNRVGCARLSPAGSRVALGTDGFAADMLEEVAGWNEIASREPASEKADARRLTAGAGLIAERWGTRFAPPMAGTMADLVVLDPAAGDRQKARVRHVVVDGRIVVRDGRLVTADIEAIRAEAARETQAVARRMERL